MASRMFKIVLVGDVSVGKTSILAEFTGSYAPATSGEYCVNDTHKEIKISLLLWDTPIGRLEESQRALAYPQTDLFLLCMSVEKNPSVSRYNRVWKGWYPELSQHCPKTPVILVGTKCELRDYPERSEFGTLYTFTQMRNLATAMGALAYIECSTVTGKNITQVFSTAVDVLLFAPAKKPKQKNMLKNIQNKLLNKLGHLKPVKGAKVNAVDTSEEFFRWGHAAAYISPVLYIFCGILEDSTLTWNANSWETIPHSEGFDNRSFPAVTTFIEYKPITRSLTLKNSGGGMIGNLSYNAAVQKILLFGGKSEGCRADVQVFDPETKKFTFTITTGTAPSPRYGMTCVTYQNNMYMMGGMDRQGKLCGDLNMLITGSMEWKQVLIQGTPPTPRMFHTAVCLNNMMVIYGGKGDRNIILDDVFLINLDNGTSERIVSEKSPGPRQNHACVSISKHEMILTGGITKGNMLSADVFHFCMVSRKWTQINIEGHFPKRQLHSTVFTGTDIVVFGGKDEQDKPLACAKLVPDFLSNQFYEVLPRDLSLLVLSYLDISELTKFGQVCRATHGLSVNEILWTRLCKLKEPAYQQTTSNTNHNNEHITNIAKISNNKTNKTTNNNNKKKNKLFIEHPKKWLQCYNDGIWINHFEILPDPKPLDVFTP